MKEVGFFVTGWYMPYFHLLIFVISEQYGEGEISQVVIFVSVLSFILFFVLYLLFILWTYVEHNQPLFCLAPYLFFPLNLVIRTLSNILYFCSFGLESLKGYINNGLPHFIKTFTVVMMVDHMGCVAQAKMVFHNICNNIESIRIVLKVSLTKVLCNIFPCVLYLHLFTPINHNPCSL